MTMLSSAFITVIIPVYNDAERLQICLQSLENQTIPKQQYEIVVIDNNSSDDVQKVVQNFQQVSLGFEKQPGSYCARNKGISLARGEVLAFTDSDCIPSPGWLEKGLQCLASVPDCGFVAGGIKFFFSNPGNPNPIELYDSLFYLQQKIYVEERGWGATANLFTFKKVFDEVGLFNTTLKSGGDAEWGRRVSSNGYKAFYAEDCYISHPARSSFKEIRKKIRRTLGGTHTISKTSQHDRVLELFTPKDTLLTQLRPPLRSAFRKSFKNQRLKNYHQKVTIFLMVFFFHYLRTFEMFQLRTEKLST